MPFKKTLTILAILFSINSNAQVVVKTNLLHPVFAGGVSFALEKQTGRKSSTSLYLSYGNKNNFLIDLYNKYEFYNATIEERFYVSKKKKDTYGCFFAPYFKFMHREYLRLDVDRFYPAGSYDVHLDGYSLGLGLTIGYQLTAYKNWLVDFMGGLGTSMYLNSNTGNDYPGYIDMRLGLSVGYNFQPRSN
ncbi:MAG: DUF3575 domain-containing protein [Bacteroidetes bacterium]|nr:DUF3575 domain-containing protein [Bacteroidota bacterium]